MNWQTEEFRDMAQKKIKTTVLIILDGFGIAPAKQKGNAITPKTAPHFFSWMKKYPSTLLDASGSAVGLFKGQEGNSEAGHLNIGAGRVVKQDGLYVSDAIKDGTFFKNNAFEQAIHHIKKYKTAAHVMGLLSNHNSAHSTPEHLYALLDLLNERGIKKVYLHLFTDGRDSGQHDALTHLKKLEKHFHGTEKIATVMGRLYAMDRNKNWDRTTQAYQAMVLGKGKRAASAEEAITLSYNSAESDEFISPTVIIQNKQPVATIHNNDAVFFFNLRSDRARQLTKSFVQSDFEKANQGAFKRTSVAKNIRFVAMTDFGPDLPGVLTAFPSRDIDHGLVATLSPRKQLYIAESEKFAHITYFLNGGYAHHLDGESWVKIDSDRVRDFEVDPGMKAKQLSDYVVKALQKNEYEFIAVNFANADMVGHTGNLQAAQKALTALDTALNRIVETLVKVGGQGVITADHGNAEEMINLKTGEIDSEHSVNPVPFIMLNYAKRVRLTKGKLPQVAPTILKMMQIPKPKEMTSKPLF